MSVFMFTDIENSSRLWEKHPEVMAKALARHDLILRGQIAAHGGKVIKHLGDGVFAVFETGLPLTCALEIQRQLSRQDWGKIGTLRVRMAFHAGEAYRRGGDYFGPVVNRTARILTMGGGGQILVTPEVLNLAEIPDQATLRDLGVHRLRDLTTPQQIYQLMHPDLIWQAAPRLHSRLSRSQRLPITLWPTPWARKNWLDRSGRLTPQLIQ